MTHFMSTSIPLVADPRQSDDIGATLKNWPDGLPILPESTPTSALDAALILAEIGGVFPVNLHSHDRKRPAVKRWQETSDRPTRDARGEWHGSTRRAYVIRAWWGRDGDFNGPKFGVGLALRDAGLVALDIDDARGADQLAQLAAAAGGWSWPTFAILSAKGPKLIYRRPAQLADLNNVKGREKDKAGANVGVGVAACDILFHYALCWSPDRRWFGAPADVADLPGDDL